MEPRWSDEDVLLAEALLDGALGRAESEELARRLEREPALVELVGTLRAQRAVRATVWAASEPNAAEADAVASRVIAAAAGAERWRRALQTACRATAVAAMVMVAFGAGWVVRGKIAPAQGVARPAESRPWALAGGGRSFPVALTDERGNVIAVQHFDDPTQARQFADDVGRWQAGSRRRTPATELVIPVSGEF